MTNMKSFGYFAIAQYDKFVKTTKNLSFALGLAFATPFCHFEPFVKRRKIQRNLRHTLNLWILRCAQYDKNLRYFLLFKVSMIRQVGMAEFSFT